MTADVDRRSLHKRRFVAWVIAGVVALAVGLAWLLAVGYGSVDWPDFMEPWIRYFRPAVLLSLVGAAFCFARAAGHHRSSRKVSG